jgi:hypothetical protein
MSAVDKLAKSHLEQLDTKATVKVSVPVLGDIFVRPVVNAAKSLEIEAARMQGEFGQYIFLTLMHHCIDGDERPLLQRAEKTSLFQQANYETIAAIFNEVKEVIDTQGVDVKKL